MGPIQAKELYKRTAQKLNLPEEYVKDFIEYYYSQHKSKMHNLEHVIFNVTGLGRFIVKPLSFFRRECKLFDLVHEYESRKDNRGLMIRRELESRYERFMSIKPEVEKYHDHVNNSRYGKKIKKDLEKQVQDI